jgi:integrase
MRHAGAGRHGARLRALIVVLWRAGLRIQEALALAEPDLDQRRGSVLVRNGKGGRRREIGMDAWASEQLRPWLEARIKLPVGPLFCVIDGPTRGHAWSAANARVDFRRTAAKAGVRRRFAPHQLRPRPRDRARARGRAAERDPAPARPRQPRHHLDLPPRDRHRGDHRHRPRPASADDARDRRPPTLSTGRAGAFRRSRYSGSERLPRP